MRRHSHGDGLDVARKIITDGETNRRRTTATKIHLERTNTWQRICEETDRQTDRQTDTHVVTTTGEKCRGRNLPILRHCRSPILAVALFILLICLFPPLSFSDAAETGRPERKRAASSSCDLYRGEPTRFHSAFLVISRLRELLYAITTSGWKSNK